MFVRLRLRFVAARFALACAFIIPAPQAHSLACDAGLPADPVRQTTSVLTSAVDRRVEAMAHVAAGSLAEDDGPDDALLHYQRALDLDPSNAPLARQVAGILLRRGEAPEALSVLKDAYKRNPNSGELALQIAGVYVVSLRKFDLAARYATQALKLAPDLIETYQLLYTIRRATGQLADAEALLRQAAARPTKQAEFWAGLGDLYLRQVLAAEDADIKHATDVALTHYRHAVELAQQDAAVLLRALNFFSSSGYFEDAISCARRLLVLDPSDTVSREKLALALASLKHDDEAYKELEIVVAENPASLAAYRMQGEILLRRGDNAGAVDKFEKALVLHDEDPRLYLELVDLCLKNGDIARATRWLGEARMKFNRLPQMPYYEGQLLGQLQRWREALNAFDLAADLAAKYQPSFLTPEFHFQHGMMAERAGDHAEAARYLQACLALDPNYTEALNYLGYMWAERGENLVLAEEYIRRALQNDPNNPAFLDSLGWVLHQQGRYLEALPPLEQAVRTLMQPDATIEEHLGDVLEKLGRKQEALKAWERASTLEGASPRLPAKLQSVSRSLASSSAEAKAVKP